MRGTLSALCANLLGIGLLRFAYTPLIPALIAGGWFAPGDAAYLGAANFAGYLIGALAGQRLATRGSVAMLVRAMMLLGAASLFGCALPLSFSWFFAWRFASGLPGGVLMVVAAPAVLPHVPAARRGLVGGFLFAGIGLGIVIAGTLVPALLALGLAQAWIGLGVLALVLTAIAWRGWPPTGTTDSSPAPAARTLVTAPLLALYGEFALNAVGLVPHMVFLVDFVARGLGRGLAVGGSFWVLFGVGAAAGPVLGGYVADRIGFRATLRAALLLQTLAVGVLAVSDRTAALIASSLFVGTLVPGVASLVLGRVREIIPHESAVQKAAWSLSTASFAVGQAAAAYGFSFIFANSDGAYALLFALGAAAAALGLVLDFAIKRSSP